MRPRFVVRKDGQGWRVVDEATGRLHSARIKKRSRALSQANTLNRMFETSAGSETKGARS